MINSIPYLYGSFFADTLNMFSRKGMMIWVLVPSLLGIGVYFLFRRLQLFPLRWLGVLPILFGIIMGIGAVSLVSDVLYRDYYFVRQTFMLVHWAVLIVPILALASLFVFEFLWKKSRAQDF